MRSLLFGVTWLVAVLSVSPRAAADSVLVESYVAPEVCPDVSRFEAELRQRSAASAVPQGNLRVRIETQPDGFFGQIQRVEHAADLGTRELRHASCEQLVHALALIGALLLRRMPTAVLYCCAETWLVMAIRVNTKRPASTFFIGSLFKMVSETDEQKITVIL